MFDKLLQVQQQADEIKKRLDAVTVSGEAEGGKIRVTATGNKYITSIQIDNELFGAADKEELEELLAVAVNKAIEQAENVHQSEMQALSQNMLGGLGNLFGGQ
ncbi:YbaB/EbfC family nucleoid-associated protein [Pararcticibacter amylolyticus]|uniref:Nucleoid-associated protein DDR33_01300 n=1 Tax=Pararcticibacter amylolyticus TaxID=2173175 RepID=A0A2U2PMN1_9SPHI|nr:YbaB/EbfC family nucleoid-associated protein [Pararcticibacter amylolyticus]PWG82532.1 nucleoid-associated protein, YbaB/EbfC family [Pararcticibacter amylolyticus]